MEILYGVLLLLAGCGVFMTGMQLLSDGLESSSGKGIRKMFNKISDNRFAGVSVGAGVTAIIQSSSATTVMVIGFVNAGVMTLIQATAIIMGANIGTTVTGLLVSFSAFKIGKFLSALALVGVFMMMFSKKDAAKSAGSVMTGLGMIFVGLDLMGSAFDTSGSLGGVFTEMFGNEAMRFPLLLILLGTVLTAIVQSSSAVTGVIITMAGVGILPVLSAFYIVLGTNIGTCITAILASVGASTNAKRAALIHLIFNIFGSVIFAVLLALVGKFFVSTLQILAPDIPAMQVAYFHICFNVVTCAVLLPFVKQLTQLATKIIKDKPDDGAVEKLYFIDDRILHTPAIAVAQVLKEVENMRLIAKNNLDRSIGALLSGDLKDKDKIARDERRLNFINKGIAGFLIKISALSLNMGDEKLVGSLHHVISDIERIGDHAENFFEEAETMKERGVTFSSEAEAELKAMYETVSLAFEKSGDVFRYRDLKGIKDVDVLEAKVDAMKTEFQNNHIARLNAGNCSVESGSHFYAVISELERVADHLVNIAYSIRPRGDSG
ncbi:MAG: Na/Pi cotransporter family protein [Clostridiales bacterium]|jgi:phosphate:Na+ symporter|nr:Na/Pi cotransporter family protein [Clostridiales bacterium]